MSTPGELDEKLAALPGRATSVTPGGAPFNPVRNAVVVKSSKRSAALGYTSMRVVIGPPSPVAKKPE